MKCEICGKDFERDQYVYEVKTDDGKIHLSHGGSCLEGWKINRLPIQAPDWWIRTIGKMQLVLVKEAQA